MFTCSGEISVTTMLTASLSEMTSRLGGRGINMLSHGCFETSGPLSRRRVLMACSACMVVVWLGCPLATHVCTTAEQALLASAMQVTG